MKKLTRLCSVVAVIFLSVNQGYASHETEPVKLLKVRVMSGKVLASFETEALPNADLCTHESSASIAGVDLEVVENSNYLYTQLMTALVSEKKVSLSLSGCLDVGGGKNIPAIEAVEVHRD